MITCFGVKVALKSRSFVMSYFCFMSSHITSLVLTRMVIQKILNIISRNAQMLKLDDTRHIDRDITLFEPL